MWHTADVTAFRIAWGIFIFTDAYVQQMKIYSTVYVSMCKDAL